MFSNLTRWTLGPDTGIGIASLAAKSVLTQFKQAVDRWKRSAHGFRSIANDNKRRAPWMFPRPEGAHLTHLHLFMKRSGKYMTMSEANEAFAALSPEEQNRYKERAFLERTRARATPSRLELVLQDDDADKLGSGPLGMSSIDGPFPMVASSLRLFTDGKSLNTMSDEWVKKVISPAPESADSFCEPLNHEPCIGGCRNDLRSGAISAGITDHLWKYIRLAVRYTYDEHLDDPMVVLKFVASGSLQDGIVDVDRVVYVLVTHAQKHGDSLFEAEFVRLCIGPGDAQSTTFADPRPPHLFCI